MSGEGPDPQPRTKGHAEPRKGTLRCARVNDAGREAAEASTADRGRKPPQQATLRAPKTGGSNNATMHDGLDEAFNMMMGSWVLTWK